MEFLTNNFAPIMFGGLIVFLLLGFPVAFSLGACGLFFGFVGIELGLLPEALLQALPLRIFGIMQNDTLLAIPFFLKGWSSGEMSPNTGGLIRWPVYVMIPLGFGLLLLQGWSELIKRLAFLQGLIEDPTHKKVEKTAEEELAEAIQKLAEEKAAKANAA